MTKKVLPGSRNKNDTEQQAIVGDFSRRALAVYEYPKAIEAAVCILAQYVISNGEIRLFSDNPMTVTRCQETVRERQFQLLVGNFSSDGLQVSWSGNYYVSDHIGVAGLRKFL